MPWRIPLETLQGSWIGLYAKPFELLSLFSSDHTHRQWRSTMNAVEEDVAEELLPYKELFTTVLLQKDYEPAATSCFCGKVNCKRDEFYCRSDKLYYKRDKVNCKGDEFNCKML